MGLLQRKFDDKMRILSSCLPEIECPPDCSLCCEVDLGLQYPTSHWERDEFIWHINADRKANCCNFNDGRCLVYDVRPLICRLFFKSEGAIECFIGLEPSGGKISAELFRRIVWCATQGTISDARAIKASI